MGGFKLSSPWVQYATKVSKLFERDPNVAVEFDNEAMELKLLVEGQTKASAIDDLLPDEVEFGNVTLKVIVIPANSENPRIDLVRKAFEGNPIVEGIHTVADIPLLEGNSYVVFKPEVVQFFVDDLGEYDGVTSTLYENIAEEIMDLRADGIFFSTGMSEQNRLSVPLGEWP